MDSNAPPRSRGTPLDFVKGIYPVARGRPLVKLRDGPEFCRINNMHHWDWNAPPIRGNTSVNLCAISVSSVVKNINRIRIRAGTIRTWETEWTGKGAQGNIRGKPFALHDLNSLPGGMSKELPQEGTIMILSRYNIKSEGFMNGGKLFHPKTNETNINLKKQKL